MAGPNRYLYTSVVNLHTLVLNLSLSLSRIVIDT